MGRSKQSLLSDTRVWKREAAIKARSRLFSHLSASALAVLFVVILGQFGFEGLRGILVDVFFRARGNTPPHPEIALIGYDDASAYRYDRSSKIPAEELAKIFDVLAEAKPKAVGIIATVNEKIYDSREMELLARSFARVQNVFLGYTDDESLGKPPPTVLSGVVSYLPGFISRDTYSYGADGVSRRVMVNIDGIPSIYSKLAKLMNPEVTFSGPRYEKLWDSLQTYIAWQGRAGTYALTPSREVVERRVEASQFAGKVVLIGGARHSKKAEEFISTPFSREAQQTPLLEGAANGLSTLARNDGLLKPKPWIGWVLSLLIGVLTVNLVFWLAPGRGILLVLSELVLIAGGAWLAFRGGNIWFDLSHPLLVACIGYYLVIPYRLVDEYRKRWHYQEKSELMAQLEQLKSNFLSLVSHDLKTPVARIQGNAELVLAENDALTEKQRRSLTAIVQTTEDLSQYVESVLDLTRIESSKVPVQKATKDINATVLEVIEMKRFLAAEKNIELKTELEPIFSFKFDVKLMKRVLANLLENAIKYSPEGTTITLSSREEGNWVRVAISDQGFGIAEADQSQIFQKFYRCDNPGASQIKGTGLGLYLVKYFVELHQGLIDLKSELGKGSVFTVSLPV